MKKFVTWLLILCLFIGLPFSIQALEPIEFLSATVEDPESWTVTLHFSAPVTVKNKGFVWLCDRQEPNPGKEVTNTYGESYISWQSWVTGIEYLGDTADAKYAKDIRITFSKQDGYTAIPQDAGVRIVEYAKESAGVYDSGYNNGTVNVNVISGENDVPISANYQTKGGVDIAWQAVKVTQSTVGPLLSEQIADNVFRISFSKMVYITGTDIKAVHSLSDSVATEISSVAAVGPITLRGVSYAKSWDITLDWRDASEKKILLFGKDSAIDVYECSLLPDTEWGGGQYARIYLNVWDDPDIDLGRQNTDIESGFSYNFMNCDTGRSLSFNGRDVFTLESAGGTNLYYIKDEQGRYLNFNGTEVRVSDVPSKILLYPCDYERYRIVVSATAVLADDDTGESNKAVLMQKKISDRDISTGWYLTESTEPRPLRVMPLGDSITYGVNDTLTDEEYRVSYREQLSQDLINYFGRVVFVGSSKTQSKSGTAITTVDESRLLRHEGHPGWVVKHIWPDDSVSLVRDGLVTIIEQSMQKYSPDIVCLMIGTNDYWQIVEYGNSSGTALDDNIEDWLEVYGDFVAQIESAMTDNGTVICSTITPHKVQVNSEKHKKFGHKITEKVEELAAVGRKVCAADNYTAVQNAIDSYGVDAVFADNMHLKALGSLAMGAEYLSHIKRLYGADSLKTAGLQDRLDSANGEVVLTADYQEAEVVVPAGVVLDLNGHTVTADHFTVFGEVVDSTDGDGLILTGRDAMMFTYAENYLPIYDENSTGYRFFRYDFNSKGARSGSSSNPNDTNTMRYGIHLRFTSIKAYELMAVGNGGIDLYMDLEAASQSVKIAYRFKPEIGTLKKYGQICAAVFGTEALEKKTIVLSVSGMNALNGEELWVSARLQSNTINVADVDIVKKNGLDDHVKVPGTSDDIIDW